MARSGFFPCRFIGIQRRCRSRKLISSPADPSIPHTEEEVRKVLHPASNWLASSAKFPVKHSNSCLLGWTTIKKPAVGRKLSVEKDVSECMYSIIVLYLSWTLSHCVRVSCFLYRGFEKKKKKDTNTWFGKTDHVEIKSSFLGFEDPLLSRKEINKYAGREERILILRFTQISRGIIEFR